VALPASVLLVLVFLQQGYKSNLPSNLGYITFADYAYILSMAVTILTFLWSLRESNLVLKDGPKSELIAQLRWLDQHFCAFSLGYYAVLLYIGWIIVDMP